MNDLLRPEDAEEPQDNSVELEIVAPPKMVITAKEADKAARAAGMRLVSAKKMRAVAEVGKWMDQCGAYQTALGMFAFSKEDLQDGMQKCADLDKQIQDPEVRAQLLGINRGLMELYLDIAKSLLKASEKAPVQSQPPAAQVLGPPPGVAISVGKGGAVQIVSAPKQQA